MKLLLNENKIKVVLTFFLSCNGGLATPLTKNLKTQVRNGYCKSLQLKLCLLFEDWSLNKNETAFE